MLKKILLNTHFVLIGIVVLNFLIRMSFETGLTYQIDTGIKILIILSGLLLFFMNFRPFKKINYYLFIFPLASLMLLFGFVIRGMIGGIISLIVLLPFHRNEIEYQKEDITIYDNAQGFMYMCCGYKVTKKEYLIFERNLGVFKNSGSIDFDENVVEHIKDGVRLTFDHEYYDEDNDKYETRTKTIEVKR